MSAFRFIFTHFSTTKSGSSVRLSWFQYQKIIAKIIHHPVTMNQAPLVVKEESLDCYESWLERIKEEPASPMVTPREDSDDDGDHDVDMKDFKAEIRQQQDAQCSTSSSQQIPSFYIQPLLLELVRANSETNFSKDSSSELETVFVERSKCQFPGTLCLTVEDGVVKEETGDRYLPGSNAEELISSNENSFERGESGKSFKGKGYLILHSRTHNSEKPFKCSQCRKIFASRGNFILHMRTHTGEQLYKCSECGKSFKQRGKLSRHLLTHTDERPFKCSQCGKSFRSSSHLTRHMRSHSGERPYKCSQCGDSFIDSSTLTVHLRFHSGERPHKCSVCGNSFVQNSDLSKHMRTHTGKRPYICRECGKSFAQSGTLTNHLRTHTGEKPFSCTVCGKFFTRNIYLAKHTCNHTEETNV